MALPTNAQTDALFDALLRLQDAEECRMFLEDLCTIKEVRALAQRLEIARRLDYRLMLKRLPELEDDCDE